MPIPQGLKAIDTILTSAGWNIGRMRQAAKDRVQALGTAGGAPPGTAFALFGLPACRTGYGIDAKGNVNLELETWFLSLLLAEYTAGILAEKIKQGHCNNHRVAPAYNPCIPMATEHKRMLAAFRDAVKNLYDEISALEKATSVPPPPPPSVGASGT